MTATDPNTEPSTPLPQQPTVAQRLAPCDRRSMASLRAWLQSAHHRAARLRGTDAGRASLVRDAAARLAAGALDTPDVYRDVADRLIDDPLGTGL